MLTILYQKQTKMIRISLFLALFCISTAITAQDSYSVFLDKDVVAWYHNTIHNLDESVRNLASDDMKVKIQCRKDIKKNLRVLNKNAKSMALQMAGFLREDRNKELSKIEMNDGVEMNRLDLVNSQIRRNKNLVELKMSTADLEVFNSNLAKIEKADKELSEAGYQLWSKDPNRKAAMQPQLQAITSSARANSEFIVSNSVN